MSADPTQTADCPRAWSDMTPCVLRDGELAQADDGACVGCGWRGSDDRPTQTAARAREMAVILEQAARDVENANSQRDLAQANYEAQRRNALAFADDVSWLRDVLKLIAQGTVQPAQKIAADALADMEDTNNG